MQETQETWVQPLGWEDPLEEEMEAHSSILAWRVAWTEEPGGLQFIAVQSLTPLSDHTCIILNMRRRTLTFRRCVVLVTGLKGRCAVRSW